MLILSLARALMSFLYLNSVDLHVLRLEGDGVGRRSSRRVGVHVTTYKL
jgi:hypothetical protein